MAVEREHGISVSSAVMSFARQGFAFNLARAKFVGSQASLLKRQRSARSPANGLHLPYALVLGYGGTSRRRPGAAIAG
jgi:hypothetical protein